MKKFIELTMMQGIKVHVNVDSIGHIYETEVDKIKVTIVSTTTHHNGGLRVLETAKEILNLINN